jgi:gliding motility associated protien GldN
MKNQIFKYIMLFALVCSITNVSAQKKKTPAKPTTRKATSRTAKPSTTQKITPTVDSTASLSTAVAPPPAPIPSADTLPIRKTAKSLRPDESVETTVLRDRNPLPYEHLRADDAVYRHKVWREIDTREKINLPFRYSAEENNGNQRFISILLQAIQDSAVTVFNVIDDRFTTPMTIPEVAKMIAGEEVSVPVTDSFGNVIGSKMMRNEINLDSIYKFHIKEEVIFDKESSRLFWRILGIAPVKRVVTPQGLDLGETEIFWVYYPDMRPVFAKYEVYNGKNFGARMSWEELFESRMFYGRIIKSTIDNPYDQYIKNTKGLTENTILQLLEGENLKEKIFNYEQNLWSY